MVTCPWWTSGNLGIESTDLDRRIKRLGLQMGVDGAGINAVNMTIEQHNKDHILYLYGRIYHICVVPLPTVACHCHVAVVTHWITHVYRALDQARRSGKWELQPIWHRFSLLPSHFNIYTTN